MKKQRRCEGDVVAIDLGEQHGFAYARVLPEPLVGFYDFRSADMVNPDELEPRSIFLRLWVMNHAITSGRWEVIGNLPLEPTLLEDPVFFKQDPIDKSISLYQGGREWPAEIDDWRPLERAAVWEPEHIEDRLRDHFLGRPNRWEQSLRPQAPSQRK